MRLCSLAVSVLLLSFVKPAQADGVTAIRRADALFRARQGSRAFEALGTALSQRLSATERPNAALLTRLVQNNARYAASLAAAQKRGAALRASAAGLSVSHWILNRPGLRPDDVRLGTALWSDAARGLEAVWLASRRPDRAGEVAAQRAGMERFAARVVLPRCRAASRATGNAAALEAAALVRAWEREMVRTSMSPPG